LGRRRRQLYRDPTRSERTLKRDVCWERASDIIRTMLPYLTRDFPGIGGTIKSRAEDFFVQEIPLYETSGEGEHVYCEIQKVGLTTFDAVHRIAAALGVSSRDIGYAGLKDARAISRQVLSILGTTEEAVMGLKIPDITVQWAARHGNKLRLGHLKENRFAIKIRDVNATDVVRIGPVLDILQRRGMPNYFGEQRFGRRKNNDKLGAALVRGDGRELLHLLIGDPLPGIDDRMTLAARTAFDASQFEEAMKNWPRRCGMERRILHRFIKTRRPAASARAVDQKIRRLWVSALQSRMFNDVAAARVDSIDQVMTGDVAYKEENGACFLVADAAVEQPRCAAFEISPTGPLVGYRMTRAEGEPGKLEEEALAKAQLTPEDFRRTNVLKVKGARRPLRVRPGDVEFAGGVDEHGPHVTVAFTLPAGSFATMLMREIMKSELLKQKPQEQEADDEIELDAESRDTDEDASVEEQPEEQALDE
jgi:tRNA pseudouridine13 synthase